MLMAKHDIFVIRESMHCLPSQAEAYAIPPGHLSLGMPFMSL